MLSSLPQLDGEMSEKNSMQKYLSSKKPFLTFYYDQQLPIAEEQIIERIINALVRENIAGLMKEAISTNQYGQKHVNIPLAKAKSALHFTIVKELSFSKIKMNRIRIVNHDGTEFLPSPSELALLIVGEGDFSHKQTSLFIKEIENSTENLALSLAWYCYQSALLENNHSDSQTESPYLQTLERIQKLQPEMDSTVLFERYPVKGHPLHPGTKTKMGMTPEEVFLYSPEFGESVQLSFAAIHQDYLRSSVQGKTPKEMNQHLFQMALDLEAEAKKRIGIEWEKYIIVPVHPWQWKHIIPQLFEKEIDKGIIYLLNSSLPAWPTLSVRTMVPRTTDKKSPHIKLPIYVQTTSAIRTLSTQAVQNGPLLTKTLQKILNNEEECNKTIKLLGELGGVNYYSPDESDRAEKAKQLAFLLRENPNQYKQKGEIAVVAAALIEPSVGTHKPLITQLITESHPNWEEKLAVLPFFEKYCDVVLPALKLLSKYGIGLEAHMQNSIITFHKGSPCQLLIRDLGGVRIDPERLKRQGITLPFLVGSAIVSSVKEAQNKITHALIQNHLGELIHCLSDYYSLPESVLWDCVRVKCKDLYARWKQDPLFSLDAADDEKVLFAPSVYTKALMTMRLLGDIQSYSFLEAENPLHEDTCFKP